MRASRLVNLLLLLQTRGRMTAPELARGLEVSVRTIYRDVDSLSEAGVPIYAERGPHGGIRLVDGYRTRLTGLTVEEAAALFLAGIPGPASELGLGSVLTAARLKVLAALPPELQASATRVSERFHLDPRGWFREGEDVPHLGAIAQALWGSRRLAIDYRRRGEVVQRHVEPLGLVLKAGTWYLVARCDGDERTYRISQVSGATVTDEAFERPPAFDLAGFWSSATAAYERSLPAMTVTLQMEPADAPAFVATLPARGARLALEAAEHTADGALIVRLSFESIEEAVAPVLRVASLAEVLDPPELRDLVVETAAAVVARHAAVAGRR